MKRLLMTLSLLGAYGCGSEPAQNYRFNSNQDQLIAGESKKTSKEYWDDTGLQYRTFERETTASSCLKSEKLFVACIEGLNAALSYGDSRLKLVTADIARDTTRFKKLNKSFGPLELVEVLEVEANEETPLREVLEAGLEQIRLEVKSLKRNYSSNTRLNFKDLHSLVKKRVISKIPNKEVAALTAAAFSSRFEFEFDPESGILPLEQFRDNSGNTELTGIGAVLKRVKKKIIVVRTLEGGGARAARMKGGDVVTKINGVLIPEDQKLSETVDLIRGKEGTTVKLTVDRDGKEIEFSIVRKKIVVEAVVVKDLYQEYNNVNYGFLSIKLRTFVGKRAPSPGFFGGATYPLCDEVVRQWDKAVDRLRQRTDVDALGGVIVDFRDNGGGYITEAQCIGSLFLDRGLNVTTVSKFDGTKEKLDSIKSFNLVDGKKVPIITLVNGSSASASELVSSAWQDHEVSFVMGQPTFGKGSVQNIIPRWKGNSKIGFRNTIALYLRPLGASVQYFGVTPDFTVSSRPNATAEDDFAVRERDLFAFPLKPTNLPSWQQTRTNEISKVSNCMSKTSLAEDRYQSLIQANGFADFQLLSAQEAIICQRIN